MSGPVILFGLDGATYTVLDDLVGRGVMPYLGRFMASGARAVLHSTVPPLTPPAWTTLVTGRSPGHHGITNFLQYESSDTRYVRVISSREVRCETIWSMVNRHGLQAGCLNFVAHGPAPKIQGYVVPGWLSWRWVKKYSHPAGLIDGFRNDIAGFDVKELAMDFQQEHKAVAGARIEDPESWVDMHIRRERQWFNILHHQMQHEPCALVGIVFDGVDKLQHLLWEYLDPAMEPEQPSQEFLRIREKCWDYFRRIDHYLESTVESAGPDAHVLVVSDHGFAGSHEVVYINTWLEQQGYLTWKPNAKVAPEDSHELGDGNPYHLTELDWSCTRAFASSAGSNGIHIAVRGVRGDEGIAPSDYDAFRNELMEALRTRCVDPNTGEPLVTELWTREEAFSGSGADLAPDITLALRDHGFFSVLRGKQVLKTRPMVIGTHHPEGILIAGGPRVQAGEAPEPLEMVDIAPTLLYALGLPVPADLEGTAATGLFTREYVESHPVQRGAATVPPAHWSSDLGSEKDEPERLDAEGEAEVLMRLKALGYIE
ncbi:MAG: alkaline phosphatase family protein [Planctomycetes bacterium]|nr:alkaline phosphatase family protein [Planctomycetota bacterium]